MLASVLPSVPHSLLILAIRVRLSKLCLLLCIFTFRKKAERGKIYFTNLQAKENTPSMINPKPCGHLCCCAIKGCEEVQRGEELQEKKMLLGSMSVGFWEDWGLLPLLLLLLLYLCTCRRVLNPRWLSSGLCLCCWHFFSFLEFQSTL